MPDLKLLLLILLGVVSFLPLRKEYNVLLINVEIDIYYMNLYSKNQTTKYLHLMERHRLSSTLLEDEATVLDCYDPSLVAAVYNLSSKVHAHCEPGFSAVLGVYV